MCIRDRLSSQFYTADEFSFILKQIDASVATGRNRFEFVLPLKDGSRMPVIVSSRRLEDPEGREFAIVTFTDISDQKSAEAQLRDANVRLELRQKDMDEDLALAARVQQSLAPKSIVWGGLRVDTSVSYTHLDVYKRQRLLKSRLRGICSG